MKGGPRRGAGRTALGPQAPTSPARASHAPAGPLFDSDLGPGTALLAL